MTDKKCIAIVLAAGAGRRMNTDIPKQYLPLNGKPVIYYSLKAFEDSFIDEIVLVCGKGDAEYCRETIVDKYSFTKIRHIVEGGNERYDSVWNGLLAASDANYVFIHDGARPFITAEVIERAYSRVRECGACIVGVPVKDTIKVVDDNGNVRSTPNRKYVYQVQTPQVFEKNILENAYAKLYALSDEDRIRAGITDDSMIVETFTDKKVSVVLGDYFNIKITTQEDMILAGEFVKKI